MSFRRRNGCDADSGAVSFDITCVACNGRGGDCTECGGAGVIELHRCGAHYQTPDISRALESRARLQAYHVLPVPGAWSEQAAQFVDFLTVFDSESSREQAEQREERERIARARK